MPETVVPGAPKIDTASLSRKKANRKRASTTRQSGHAARAMSLAYDGTSELRRHLTAHLAAAQAHCISCFLKALKQIALDAVDGQRIAFL